WAMFAARRTRCTAGMSSATKTAIMAITTSNSIKVKPCRGLDKDMLRLSNGVSFNQREVNNLAIAPAAQVLGERVIIAGGTNGPDGTVGEAKVDYAVMVARVLFAVQINGRIGLIEVKTPDCPHRAG